MASPTPAGGIAPGDARALESLSEMLVLAAVARAERHKQAPGVSLLVVAEHLDLPRSTGSTRRLGPFIERLRDEGAITQAAAYARDGWTLTPLGRRRLTRARRAGKLPALPESPQHRRWRRERQRASEEIDALRAELFSTLAQAASHLYARSATSEDWRRLARGLQIQCSRLARTIYSLRERPEPDDTPAGPLL
ncbi:MAG TPA: hypothetical protein VED41_00320, partial [Solirubrobacteraceae bacterium]|nr:hypothetical protein [Solirubrobacteraceae bacterium]